MTSVVRRIAAMPSARWGSGNMRRWHDVASPGRLGDASPPAHLPAALRAYLRALHCRPLAAATVGAAAAAAAGDAMAQSAYVLGADGMSNVRTAGAGPAQHRDRYAAMAAMAVTPTLIEGAVPETGVLRMVRFAAVVGTLVGAGGELWFRRLLRPFPGWTYDVALRTMVDQTLFAPAVLACSVSCITLASSGDAAYAWGRIAHDAVHPLGQMWTLWTCGLAANYVLVQGPWQSTFAFGLAVLWTSLVSARVHQPIAVASGDVQHQRMDAFRPQQWESAGPEDVGGWPQRMEAFLRRSRRWDNDKESAEPQAPPPPSPRDTFK